MRTLRKWGLWKLSIVQDSKLYKVIASGEVPYWSVRISQTPTFLLAVLRVTPWAFLLHHEDQETLGVSVCTAYPPGFWFLIVLIRSPPRVDLQLLVTLLTHTPNPEETVAVGFACVLPCTREGEAGERAWVWKLRTPRRVPQFGQSLTCPRVMWAAASWNPAKEPVKQS